MYLVELAFIAQLRHKFRAVWNLSRLEHVFLQIHSIQKYATYIFAGSYEYRIKYWNTENIV